MFVACDVEAVWSACSSADHTFGSAGLSPAPRRMLRSCSSVSGAPAPAPAPALALAPALAPALALALAPALAPLHVLKYFASG